MASVERLGCGTYQVWIQERCGSAWVCQLKDASSIQWGRVLNSVSSCTVEVALQVGGGRECCDCISEAVPWAREIVVYRDDELVWVGPITSVEIDMANESATIQAKDLMAWVDHRVLELANEDYEVEAADLSDIFGWLLNHAYCKDPFCLTWSFDQVGIPLEQYYPSFDKAGGDRWVGQYLNIGDELRRLSQAGMDWAVVRRHLYGGDIEIAAPDVHSPILLDQHLQTLPKIRVDGDIMANRVIGVGGGGGTDGWYDDQVYIIPDNPYGPLTEPLLDGVQQRYGLLEKVVSEQTYDEVDTTETPNAIQQSAKANYDLLSLPYVSISQVELNRDAPFPMNSLYPGTLLQVALTGTCWKLSDYQYRITQINVSVSGANETVSLQMQPTGRVAL